MPAKHKTHFKRTTRRRVVHKKEVPASESSIQSEQETVIPDTPAQPVQQAQSNPLAQSIPPSQGSTPSSTSSPFKPEDNTISANTPATDTSSTSTQPSNQATPPQQPSIQTSPLTFDNSQPQTSEAQTVETSIDNAEIKMGTESSATLDQTKTDINTTNSDDKINNPPSQVTVTKKHFLLPIIFIVLLAIAVITGLYLYRQSFTTKNVEKEKVTIKNISPAPKTPTPEAIDLTKFTINVLNGSETAGAASGLKSSLESEGFDVPSIGNADASTYEDTVIQAKKEVDKEYLEKLKEFLEKSYVVAKVQELDEDSQTDVVVIIGSKTAE